MYRNQITWDNEEAAYSQEALACPLPYPSYICDSIQLCESALVPIGIPRFTLALFVFVSDPQVCEGQTKRDGQRCREPCQQA
jgi:hypothetical protein